MRQRRCRRRDQRRLGRFVERTLATIGVADAMADDLVAARPEGGHHRRRRVIDRRVGKRGGRQAEPVEFGEQPEHADAVAIVAP